MALTTNEMGAADIQAITGGGYRNGGIDNDLWIIILFILMANNGWGNGFGNNGGGGGNGGGYYPYVTSDVQRGFDQSAIMNGITALQGAVNCGFGDTALAIAGVNQGMCNGFSQAEIAANARQIADMNQNFNAQIANMQSMNALQAQLAQCCCDNRLATNDLKYTVATEACADRAVVNDALRDVITNQTANTQAILDKMCQQELDAERRENDNLRQQINMMSLAASQTAQTAQLIADNNAQTQYVVNRVAPYPTPAYVVPNPTGCNNNYGFNNCGCNVVA